MMDYKKAKQLYDEQHANHIAGKRNWQIATYVSLGLNIILVVALSMLSMQRDVAAYIIEVDTFGRAKAMGFAAQTEIKDERIIKAFIYRYLHKARSVVTDGELMRKNFSDVYAISDSTVSSFLNDYYQQHNPYEIVKSRSVQIKPVSFLRQSENSYLIEWDEIHRDLSLTVLEQKRWQALMSIHQSLELTKEDVMNNPDNPFGFYVTHLSWSEIK